MTARGQLQAHPVFLVRCLLPVVLSAVFPSMYLVIPAYCIRISLGLASVRTSGVSGNLPETLDGMSEQK